MDAIRAAEYVRSDAILGWEGGRRSFAAISGLMAFAELNPDATAAQLALFLSEFDQAIRTRYDHDPDLRTNEHLITAVRFATVEHPDLDGLDTRVGERALALLGITIPKPDGFIALNNRMVRFEQALGVSLPLSDDVYDLLVRAFYGVDPSGAHRSSLPTIVNDYLVADGQPASYNMVRADLTEVNDALLELPDYQGYLDAIVPGAAYDSIQAQIFADFDSIQGLTDAAIARVAAAIDEDPSLLDGRVRDAGRDRRGAGDPRGQPSGRDAGPRHVDGQRAAAAAERVQRHRAVRVHGARLQRDRARGEQRLRDRRDVGQPGEQPGHRAADGDHQWIRCRCALGRGGRRDGRPGPGRNLQLGPQRGRAGLRAGR